MTHVRHLVAFVIGVVTAIAIAQGGDNGRFGQSAYDSSTLAINIAFGIVINVAIVYSVAGLIGYFRNRNRQGHESKVVSPSSRTAVPAQTSTSFEVSSAARRRQPRMTNPHSRAPLTESPLVAAVRLGLSAEQKIAAKKAESRGTLRSWCFVVEPECLLILPEGGEIQKLTGPNWKLMIDNRPPAYGVAPTGAPGALQVATTVYGGLLPADAAKHFVDSTGSSLDGTLTSVCHDPTNAHWFTLKAVINPEEVNTDELKPRAPSERSQSVEARLRSLQRLEAEGLITQDEAAETRSKILGDL